MYEVNNYQILASVFLGLVMGLLVRFYLKNKNKKF